MEMLASSSFDASSAFRPYLKPYGFPALSPTDKMPSLSPTLSLIPELTSLPTDTLAQLLATNPSLMSTVSSILASQSASMVPSGMPQPTPTTVPSVTSPSEPSHVGGGGKAKRKRTTFTSAQAAILEKEYETDQYMPRSRRMAVADSLSLSENQIKTWFQNRRAKDKKTRSLTNSLNAATASYMNAAGSSPAPSNAAPSGGASPVPNNGDAQSPCPSSYDSSTVSITPPMTFLPPAEAPIPAAPSQSLLELLAMGQGADLIKLGLINDSLLANLAAAQQSNA